MDTPKNFKDKLEEKHKIETTSVSILIEKLQKLKESMMQESLKSGDIENGDNLLGFETYIMNKYKKEFKGKKLEKHYNGQEIKNNHGNCFSIISEEKININISSSENAKLKYLSDFKVIDGIGEFYEKKLYEEGYESLTDLRYHYKFGTITKEFQKLTNKTNSSKLLKWLERRFLKSHHLVFLVSSFYSPNDFIFIDIETLGLHGFPLFLIGIAYFENQTLVIEQILARDLGEEKAAIVYLSEKLKKKKAIVSYNGKSFDIPLIKNRMGFYSVNMNLNQPHFDIYHFSKNAFQDILNDFKLISIERKILNIERKDHIESLLVPKYYNDYLKTKNIGLLIPIIEHNKQDIVSTVKIFAKIHELWG